MRISYFISLIIVVIAQFASASTGIESPGQLRALVQEIVSRLEPMFVRQQLTMGAIDIQWDKNVLQAGARYNPESREVQVQLTGGLVRAEGITSDAVALAICHEMGHVLGGAPKWVRKGKPRARVVGFEVYKDGGLEGQADYFATLKCFREVFKNENNQAYLLEYEKHFRVLDPQTWKLFGTKTNAISLKLKSQCNRVWNDASNSALCIRAGLAAENLVNVMENEKLKYFLAKGEKYEKQLASFDSPSETVSEADGGHGAPQCRLDTFLQGALCRIPFSAELSDVDPNIGFCISGSTGARPRCWFDPDEYPGAWKNLVQNGNSEWNGVGVIDNKCTGFLLETGGNPDSNSLVMTNGHCARPGDVPTSFVLNQFRDVAPGNRLEIPVKDILFSTMDKIDLGILRLSLSIKQLKARGFQFYKLAVTPTIRTQVSHVGIPQRKIMIESAVLTKSNCEILEETEIRESVWRWKVKRTNCTNVSGLSGSPLFLPLTREVVGILNTTVEPNYTSQACELNKPCEIDPKGQIKLYPEISYAQKTDLILGCFDQSGSFNLKLQSCLLK